MSRDTSNKTITNNPTTLGTNGARPVTGGEALDPLPNGASAYILGGMHRRVRAVNAHVLQLALAAALALSIGTARAGSDGEAGVFVQTLGAKFIGLMRQDGDSRAVRENGFRDLLADNFDIAKASHAALGPYRRQATERQLARYKAIYLDYVLAVYGGMFANYVGESLVVTGSQVMDGGDVMVQGRIDRRGREAIRITFRVRRLDGGFKVLDILVEGISMLVTQRSQFASVIRSEGMDGFLERLQEMVQRSASYL